MTSRTNRRPNQRALVLASLLTAPQGGVRLKPNGMGAPEAGDTR